MDHFVGGFSAFKGLFLPTLAGLFGRLQGSRQASPRLARSVADFAEFALIISSALVRECFVLDNLAVSVGVH